MDVTIVIPTKNGGDLFRRVLEAIFQQKTEYSYEVICVDSGSRDGTQDLIRQFPVKLFEIPPEEFGHGRTRNYGAAQGEGTYIVFLTQDALPVNELWLQKLVEAMELEDGIAGAFGSHLPYPDGNIFDRRDLPAHFARFGAEPHVFAIEDREQYDRDIGLRLFLSFFSDNNSCLRRSIWEKHPYEDVNYAEDQIWARKMLEMGYKKAYAPEAQVYHSHDFGILEYAKRVFDDLRGHYIIHDGFRMIPTLGAALSGMVRSVYSDARYTLSLGMSLRDTFYCLWLGTGRDIGRNIGGWLGSNFYEYPKWVQRILDRNVSQQYRQLRG